MVSSAQKYLRCRAVSTIDSPDVCNYLEYSPNPDYNNQTMKCHKILEAHNFFTRGYVRKVGVAESISGEAVIVRISVSTTLHSVYSPPVCFSLLVLVVI